MARATALCAEGIAGGEAARLRRDLERERAALERLIDEFRASRHLEADPLGVVRSYSDPADQEIAAMIAAAFAYGRVDLINQTVRTLLEALGPRPRQALEAGRHLEPGFLPGFRYRFNRTSDCVGLCHSLAEMVREHGSLGASLVIRRADVPTFDEALARWVVDLRDRASLVAPRSRGLHFLLPDPSLGGVCKRWRLFLRWMIRPADGTDLGLWHGLLSPAELTLPLDAHWTRIGPRLGWTQRRTPGRGMAEDLTRALRKYAPEDPLRYDFAICHLGISGACPPKLELRHCLACPLAFLCRTGRTRVGRHRSSLRGAPPLG